VGDSLCRPRDTLYLVKLSLTSPTSGGHLVGIVRACRLKPWSLFWRFVTMFTRAWHWSLSWMRCIKSMPVHALSLRSILILLYHLQAVILPSMCATCRAHLILLDLINLIIFGEVYKLRWSSHSFLQPPIIVSLFGHSILVSILFSNNLQPLFSL
jgi:hypothetical protein